MCGICGQLVFHGREEVNPTLVTGMMRSMDHRGPDDEGIYSGSEAALGHKRLSIIDLSRGKQPISNEDHSVWIVFNGEIYNFKELRNQLLGRGHVFRTETDTEVIVHLYEEYGEGFLERLRGMFAFAIWDERKRKLLLARDRAGIKPLYYSSNANRLIFASEMKALIVDRSLGREVDPEAIGLFLTFKYLPGERTLLRDVRKLMPGHYLVSQNGETRIRQYWDLKFAPAAGDADLGKATADLVELLRETVRDHMISDVPVGVLLSGGVDSTALLSFVVEESQKEVETFTVGFGGREFADERPYARLAAETFGSRHHEMTISAQDFLEFLPRYVWHMEEPVCEPPAVALYYVSRLASNHVKVLLSGEGGDEAFAGYQNYRNLLWLERMKRVGWPVTKGLASLLGQIGRLGGARRAAKYSQLMQVPIAEYYYGRTWDPLSGLHASTGGGNGNGMRSRPSAESKRLIAGLFENVGDQGVLNQMLYVDSKTWLPDDLLVKADKMTMANSVELRVPFLDHRVLEFAAGLPESAKVRGLTTKYILKRAFEGRIPQSIINRPKTGFPVPYEAWFQGELHEPLRDILSDRRTRERGYLDQKTLSALISSPEGTAQRAADVFSILVLEIWHRQFADSMQQGPASEALVSQSRNNHASFVPPGVDPLLGATAPATAAEDQPRMT
jgi:asparagine synthase (glutamine-hydrolysing)